MIFVNNSKRHAATFGYRIFGKIIDVMKRSPLIPQKYMGVDLQVPIIMNIVDSKKQADLWKMFDEPYKLSLFYKASPILIRSKKEN